MLEMYSSKMSAALDSLSIERPQWLGLIARASVEMLEEFFKSYTHLDYDILKPFERVSYMVQGRTGNTGQRFNVGEVCVSRVIIKLHIPSATTGPSDSNPKPPTVGVAYLKSGTEQQTLWAAMADALLQDPDHHHQVVKALIEPLKLKLIEEHALAQRKVKATQVEFFTVARENNASTL
jgi:alpha-D-ribose 1-methylphosphonate 5-triphosphate synthase subunit PhnG